MALLDDIKAAATAAAGLGSMGAQAATSWAQGMSDSLRVQRFDADMAKAAAAAKAAGNDGTHDHKAARDPKALHFNPFDLVAAMNYRDRPSSVTYGAMETIGWSVPVIADVINVRTHQVSMFTTIPEDRYSSGFRVRHKQWRDRTPTKKERTRASELEEVLGHTGYVDPTVPDDSTPFTEFAKMFIHDSLTFDQGTFEVVPDRKGRPSYISIVDPASIRLLDPQMRDQGDPFAVQVLSGSIVTDFMKDELAFCVRNPRSGVRSYGYGTSEIETLVREITGFLWSMDYNRKFFVNGSATKGILNFKGTMPDNHMQAFRRQWYAMVSGVSNSWRTPITNAEDLQWINMQLSNRDMEYSAWMDFLIKIVCARYLIAPEEVNFAYGNTGQSQAMGGVPIEEKLTASRDLGLHPLVRWFFVQLNRNFISRIDGDYEAIPVGLDSRGPMAEADLLAKQTSVYLTVDEARKRMELEPLGEKNGGNVILNPTWLQYMQNSQPGEEGENPDEGGGYDDFSLHPSEGDDPPGVDSSPDNAIKSDVSAPIVRYLVDTTNTED